MAPCVDGYNIFYLMSAWRRDVAEWFVLFSGHLVCLK